MKAKFLLIALSFILAVLFAGPAAPADVAQGKCMQYDTAGKRIILEEYSTEKSPDHPYGNRPAGLRSLILPRPKSAFRRSRATF